MVFRRAESSENGLVRPEAALWPIRKTGYRYLLFRMFKAFEFCLPTNAAKVPAGPEWLHEIRHDSFRIRVERDGDRVRLEAHPR